MCKCRFSAGYYECAYCSTDNIHLILDSDGFIAMDSWQHRYVPIIELPLFKDIFQHWNRVCLLTLNILN